MASQPPPSEPTPDQPGVASDGEVRLERALRPISRSRRRPISRIGTLLRSTLGFGRRLGTGLSRREQVSSPVGAASVRVPDGAWHLPVAEEQPAGPVDSQMAALAASMRRNRPTRQREPEKRGIPLVSRRMGRARNGELSGPTALPKRIRAAESAVPMNESHGADRAAERANQVGGAPRPTSPSERGSRERTDRANPRPSSPTPPAPRSSTSARPPAQPRGDRSMPRRSTPSGPATRRPAQRGAGSTTQSPRGASTSSSSSPRSGSAPALRRSPGTVAGPGGSSVRSAMAVTRGAAAQSLAMITAQVDAAQAESNPVESNPGESSPTLARSSRSDQAVTGRGHLRLVPPMIESEVSDTTLKRAAVDAPTVETPTATDPSPDRPTVNAVTDGAEQSEIVKAPPADATLGRSAPMPAAPHASDRAAAAATPRSVRRHRMGRIPRSLSAPVLAGRRPGDGRRVVIAPGGRLLRREIDQSSAPPIRPLATWPGDAVAAAFGRSASLDAAPAAPMSAPVAATARTAQAVSSTGGATASQSSSQRLVSSHRSVPASDATRVVESPVRRRSTSTATVVGEAVRPSPTVLAGPSSLVAARRVTNESRRERTTTNRPVARAIADATAAPVGSADATSGELSLAERVSRAFPTAAPTGSGWASGGADSASPNRSAARLSTFGGTSTPSGASMTESARRATPVAATTSSARPSGSHEGPEQLPALRRSVDPRPIDAGATEPGPVAVASVRPTAQLPKALQPVVGRELVTRRSAAPTEEASAPASTHGHRAESSVTRHATASSLSVSRRSARRATVVARPGAVPQSRVPREQTASSIARSTTEHVSATGSPRATSVSSAPRHLGHGVLLRSHSTQDTVGGALRSRPESGSRVAIGASATTPLAGRLLRRSAESAGERSAATTAPASASVDDIVRDRSRPLSERVAALAGHPIDDHGSPNNTEQLNAQRSIGSAPVEVHGGRPAPVVSRDSVMRSRAEATVSVEAPSVTSPGGRRSTGMTGFRTATPATVAPLPDVRPSVTATAPSPMTNATSIDRQATGRRNSTSGSPLRRSVDRPGMHATPSGDVHDHADDTGDAPTQSLPAVARSSTSPARPRRVVRSRTAIARRDTVRRSTSETVRRESAPITVEPADRRQSSTERLDQIEELMAALEERILRSLERRGGVQRGWF